VFHDDGDTIGFCIETSEELLVTQLLYGSVGLLLDAVQAANSLLQIQMSDVLHACSSMFATRLPGSALRPKDTPDSS